MGYYCVKVPKTISKDGEIYLYACKVKLVDGAVEFWGTGQRRDEFGNLVSKKERSLVLAPGNWYAFFEISYETKRPIGVEKWNGELISPE